MPRGIDEMILSQAKSVLGVFFAISLYFHSNDDNIRYRRRGFRIWIELYIGSDFYPFQM